MDYLLPADPNELEVYLDQLFYNFEVLEEDEEITASQPTTLYCFETLDNENSNVYSPPVGSPVQLEPEPKTKPKPSTNRKPKGPSEPKSHITTRSKAAEPPPSPPSSSHDPCLDDFVPLMDYIRRLAPLEAEVTLKAWTWKLFKEWTKQSTRDTIPARRKKYRSNISKERRTRRVLNNLPYTKHQFVNMANQVAMVANASDSREFFQSSLYRTTTRYSSYNGTSRNNDEEVQDTIDQIDRENDLCH